MFEKKIINFKNYKSSFNYKIPCSGEPRDAITQAFNLAEKPGKTGSVNLDYSDCTNGYGYIEQSYPKVRDEVSRNRMFLIVRP